MAEKVFTINTLAAEFGLSQVYVRRAVREKALPTTLVPLKKGSKINRHEITEADANLWRASVANRSRREDGRSKMTLYVSKATELPVIQEAILKAIPDFPLDELLVVANPSKAKS